MDIDHILNNKITGLSSGVGVITSGTPSSLGKEAQMITGESPKGDGQMNKGRPGVPWGFKKSTTKNQAAVMN